MLKFQDKVFDMPKKPISGFALYVSDRMPDIKIEKPETTLSELIKQIATEWQTEENVDKNYYNKKAEKDKKRFKKQLKEFQKFGYYTKTKESNEGEVDEEEEKNKNSQKRKSTSKASSQKTKKNKTTSKGKTQEKPRTRSINKKSQKVGRSQKSRK